MKEKLKTHYYYYYYLLNIKTQEQKIENKDGTNRRNACEVNII